VDKGFADLCLTTWLPRPTNEWQVHFYYTRPRKSAPLRALTMRLVRFVSILVPLLASGLAAQVAILPLSEVKPGMKAVGKTVFEGGKIVDFDVEILGVLENAGPKQSIILARLSGGPMAHTGVLQGMSGSPVYAGGKLVGAVALSFPFAKDPIAGIRPIEEMLATATTPRAPRAVRADNPFDLASLLPKPQSFDIGSSRLTEIATPFWLGGFTRGAFEQFAPMLRSAGLEPVQVSPAADARIAAWRSSLLKPGSMSRSTDHGRPFGRCRRNHHPH